MRKGVDTAGLLGVALVVLKWKIQRAEEPEEIHVFEGCADSETAISSWAQRFDWDHTYAEFDDGIEQKFCICPEDEPDEVFEIEVTREACPVYNTNIVKKPAKSDNG